MLQDALIYMLRAREMFARSTARDAGYENDLDPAESAAMNAVGEVSRRIRAEFGEGRDRG
jgi:DNA primase